MKIGLYFGSFNPIHIGHLIIASYVANHTNLGQVWFVVSPQNPFKPAAHLLNEYQRLHLARLAVEDNPQLKVSDIEFKLPKPSYTVDTLAYLHEKYPDHEFSIIMGSDSFQNINKWKNAPYLLETQHFIVYKRGGHEVKETWGAQVELLNAPLLEISATTIRESRKNNRSIRYLVPDKVLEEIEKAGYYK